jgi:Flp pilus assembly protein TadG
MSRAPRRWRLTAGQSAVEFAIIAPVLVTLLLVASDFSRLFFMSINLNNVARAGAQYGSQTVITAADLNGMKTAANATGAAIAGLTVTSSQCTCTSPSAIPPCAAAYNCGSNPSATYVDVGASATFHTLTNYPGIPSSIPLSATAIMAVQQ